MDAFNTIPRTKISEYLYNEIELLQAGMSSVLIDTFETVSANLKGKPYVITYDGDDIDYITYDLGAGLSIVKTFGYSVGVMVSITLSGDTPDGVLLTKTFHYTGDDLTSVTYS